MSFKNENIINFKYKSIKKTKLFKFKIEEYFRKLKGSKI